MKGIGKGKGIGAMNEYPGGEGIGAMYEGAGGTEFYGECYNCGEWGHSQWYCPFPIQFPTQAANSVEEGPGEPEHMETASVEVLSGD